MSTTDRFTIDSFRALTQELKAGADILVVGIDVAKKAHVAVNWPRHSLRRKSKRPKPFKFKNDLKGFSSLIAWISDLRKPARLPVVCGLESTSSYHKALSHWLTERGIPVVLVSNTVAAANKRTHDGGGWNSNDPKDALNIADLVRQGKIQYQHLNDGWYDTLKVLNKRYRMVSLEVARLRRQLRTAVLTPWFPELETVFTDNILHKDLLRILRTCPFPQDIRAMDALKFSKLCVSGRRTGAQQERMKRIHSLAGESVGSTPNDGARALVGTILDQIEFFQDQLQKAQDTMHDYCKDSEQYQLISTVPGVGKVTGPIILAELGDPDWYLNQRQVIKLAGLNLSLATSGESKQGHPAISRLGKRELRKALYIATRVATGRVSMFKKRYQYEKEKRGISNRGVAMISLTKLMAKHLRIIYAVLKNRTPYDPARMGIPDLR